MSRSNAKVLKELRAGGQVWDPVTQRFYDPTLVAPGSVDLRRSVGVVLHASSRGAGGASSLIIALRADAAAGFDLAATGSMMRLSLHPDVVPAPVDNLPVGYLKFAVLHVPRHWATLFKFPGHGQDLRLVVKTTQGFSELALVHCDHLRADGSVTPLEPVVAGPAAPSGAAAMNVVVPRVPMPRFRHDPYAAVAAVPLAGPSRGVAKFCRSSFMGAERTPHCDWHFAEGVGFNDAVAELQAFLQAHGPQ